MEEYESNSHKSKESEMKKKKKKVANGKIRKPSLGQELLSIFVPEDVSNLRDYIIKDLIIPNAKDLIWNTVGAILYPGSDPKSYGRRPSNADKISYEKYSKRNNNSRVYYESDRYERIQSRESKLIREVFVETRGEAEEIVQRMEETIATYGFVSVADLCDFAGIDSDYTLNNYGWISLGTVKINHVRGGWVVKFPKALPIE